VDGRGAADALQIVKFPCMPAFENARHGGTDAGLATFSEFLWIAAVDMAFRK
jgi:hypothetical protein